jgi:hypothetical protein
MKAPVRADGGLTTATQTYPVLTGPPLGDGSFLIFDRVSRVDFVVGVRSHTGEVLSVYLVAADIKKVVEFLMRKSD